MKSAKAAAITAIYAALYAAITIGETVIGGTLAYGPIQVRISDALLPLPMIHGIPAAIGLALGCAVANAYATGNIIDIVFGSIANLVAGTLAAKASKGRPILASTYAVIAVTLIVGSYLPLLFPIPLWLSYLSILIGESIAIYLIGYPLLKYYKKLVEKF
ncbi:MAG: QueT transporter family protein [Thermoprotei archaeon]|nr:MAG: QueT transporter family protein [Thermoprotei archaeon]